LKGKEISNISKSIGIASNNVAEYTALLEGLKLAYREGYREISIKMDSELVVKQIQGKYKVKHPDLKKLYEKVIREIKNFHDFEINHIPRLENHRADELANKAFAANH
jgi:ribonuclease HI